MDRKIFKLTFGKTGVTRLPCPTCGKGVLKINKEEFHYKETHSSKAAHRHDAWEPDWIEYVFCCMFECSNSACKESISSTGTGALSEYYGYDHEGEPIIDYVDYFTPQHFTPSLKMFTPPKNTPESVIEEINKSFSLFFSDPSSSANHVRVALENLLTHLKIKRFITRDGKRQFLSLHNRIDLLPRKFDHIKDIFLAVKWLGNAGSHSQHVVTTDDVLDAYD